MSPSPLMVAGTGSGVGKSSLVAGLGRLLERRGFEVTPFKGQNMSNNSHIAREGGEIAASQFMQARACRVEPSVHMNPILLKPNGNGQSEVVVRGTAEELLEWSEYRDRFEELRDCVHDSYRRIEKDAGVVLLEGAGSPAEPNLMDRDLVNLSLAETLNAPVVLVGDISQGGVFAWLLGTVRMLKPPQRRLIQGVVINKFQGDKTVLGEAIEELTDRLKVPVLGVIPHSDEARLPAEDSRDLSNLRTSSNLNSPVSVGLVKFPHLSNFTDFETLANHPAVAFDIVEPPGVPDNSDLIILPGTKNTVRDLRWMKRNGLFDWLQRQRKKCTHILGVCGGYQMMGTEVMDPLGIESDLGRETGFSWFDFRVVYEKPKLTRRISGSLTGDTVPVEGYEVRYGRFRGGAADPWVTGGGTVLGRLRENLMGTSVHGALNSPEVCERLFDLVGVDPVDSPSAKRLSIYDRWADVVEDHLDVDGLLDILEESPPSSKGMKPS